MPGEAAEIWFEYQLHKNVRYEKAAEKPRLESIRIAFDFRRALYKMISMAAIINCMNASLAV